MTAEDEIALAIQAKGHRVGASSLGAAEQAIFFIMELEAMIPMESLAGFYISSTGKFAAETVQALERVGAHRLASLIREANSLFLGGAVPKDPDAREQATFALPEASQRRLDDLEGEYLAYPDDLHGLRDQFIVTKRGELAA